MKKSTEVRSVPFVFMWGLLQLLRSHPKFDQIGDVGYVLGLANQAEAFAKTKAAMIDVPLDFLTRVYRFFEKNPISNPQMMFLGLVIRRHHDEPPIRFLEVVDLGEGVFAMAEPVDSPLHMLEAPGACLVFRF